VLFRYVLLGNPDIDRDGAVTLPGFSFYILFSAMNRTGRYRLKIKQVTLAKICLMGFL